MNLLWITPYLPQKDGLASYSAQFISKLRRHHQVSIMTPDDFSLLPWRMRRAWQQLRKVRPEVVHVQYAIPAYGLGSFTLWVLLALARWRLGCRVVVTFHEVKRETALLGRAGLWYYRLIAKGIDMITVHTYEAAALLVQECRVPRERVTMIPHPLYAPSLKKTPPAELDEMFDIAGKPVVLFFGFIHVDKGIDHLIKAFDIARRTDPHLKTVRLVIAGSVRTRKPGLFKWFERYDHRYEASLHELVRARRLKRAVIFTAYVPDAQVAQWFTRASVVVLPYTNLEQSGVLNQALTYRTPVIASALGGLKETLDGTEALVPPANAGALATQLSLFLTEPAHAAQLVAEYEKIRRPRTIGRVVAQIERLYAQGKQS